MDQKDILDKVLSFSIEHWNNTSAGTSALDVCSKIGITNKEVMAVMEVLEEKGKGSLNRAVQLYQIKIDLENPKVEIPDEPITTHIFFPSKNVLTENFYSTHLVREKHPEYKNRLLQGANQVELGYFSDEVLTRYFDHPEFYEIDDSLAGGHIWSKENAPENRDIYVRHGKRKLKSGKSAVTAIYIDLCNMSAEEQRHWHVYEIDSNDLADSDSNFALFKARTYEGAFVDYPDPINDVLFSLMEVNKSLKTGDLFKRTENEYLRLPVENTNKSLCDCCSELYKLIGPDNLDQKAMKTYLLSYLGATDAELSHSDSESGRPLSSLQLLALVEDKLGIECLLTKAIKAVGKYRIEADHKLIAPKIENQNYVDVFVSLCEEVSSSAKYFAKSINHEQST